MSTQKFCLFLSVAVFAFLTSATAQEAPSDIHQFARENVLGTSFELKVRAENREKAGAVEARILQEIDRLKKVMSTYDPASEISKINARPLEVGEEIPLSRPLLILLSEAARIGRSSRGAFNAYLGESIALWNQAQKDDRLPEQGAIDTALRGAKANFQIRRKNRRRFLTRRGQGQFQLDGIAKGAMMDLAVRAALRDHPDCPGLLLNIGGEILSYGRTPWTIGIADPHKSEDNAAPLTQVSLKNLAIATSGGYARKRRIAGQEFSHIIDPRTGVISATVISGKASTADALATALCLMAPKQGIAMIERTSAVCLIVDKDGTQHRSRGFAALELTKKSAPKASSAWPEKHRVTIQFEIRNSDKTGQSGGRRGRFKRHFVAAWVEDAAGRRVRVLAIWAQRNEEKYMRDLNDFWKHAWILSGEGDDPRKVRSISRATRKPGRYRLAWDGRDDAGESLPQGRYTIRIDVNREHGPPKGRERHTSIAVTIECGKTARQVSGKDQPELGGVKVAYGPKTTKKYF